MIVRNNYGTIDLPATVEKLHERIVELEKKLFHSEPAQEASSEPSGEKGEETAPTETAQGN